RLRAERSGKPAVRRREERPGDPPEDSGRADLATKNPLRASLVPLTRPGRTTARRHERTSAPPGRGVGDLPDCLRGRRRGVRRPLHAAGPQGEGDSGGEDRTAGPLQPLDRRDLLAGAALRVDGEPGSGLTVRCLHAGTYARVDPRTRFSL